MENIPDDHDRVKKKIRIKAYKIFQINNTEQEKEHLKNTINRIESFKKTKELTVDGNRISYANKCLNCSVVTHCNHKTGKYNHVNLPYKFDEFSVSTEPTLINSTIQESNNVEPISDLPF